MIARQERMDNNREEREESQEAMEACPGKREVYLMREENPKEVETARRQKTHDAVPAMRKGRNRKRRGRDSFAREALK
jgi:hypothetical protein